MRSRRREWESEPDEAPRRPRSRARRVADGIGRLLMHGAVLSIIGLAAWQIDAACDAKQDEIVKKEQEIAAVKRDITTLQAKNAGLKYNVQYLHTDDGVEKVAREKLGLIKPREVTFFVVGSPKATPTRGRN